MPSLKSVQASILKFWGTKFKNVKSAQNEPNMSNFQNLPKMIRKDVSEFSWNLEVFCLPLVLVLWLEDKNSGGYPSVILYPIFNTVSGISSHIQVLRGKVRGRGH